MCTALDLWTGAHFFARNLDVEGTYGEEVVVTPRAFPLPYRMGNKNLRHFAFLGIASVQDGTPLYFDGTNEWGLSVAALHFVGNAVYGPPLPGKENLAPYEVIPRLLGSCRSVREAKDLLSGVNVAALPFREDLPLSELHWLLTDQEGALVLETTKDGQHLYDNPIGVLTNNPPFPYHRERLRELLSLSPQRPANSLAPALSLSPFSKGMGAVGLPGDWSSPSRFLRAAFVKWNARSYEEEPAAVAQCFHILDSVSQIEGCVREEEGWERTAYSCCCHTERGILYWRTYREPCLRAVCLFHEDLEGDRLIRYPLYTLREPLWLNGRPEK